MTLTPGRPPGRPNRKALAYEGEIARLRVVGYSCKAIWELLVAEGLQLSLSSVKREVARIAKRRRPASSYLAMASGPTPQVAPHAVASTPAILSSPAFASDPRTAKEIAAAFVAGHRTNPLLRSRSSHEGSSH